MRKVIERFSKGHLPRLNSIVLDDDTLIIEMVKGSYKMAIRSNVENITVDLEESDNIWETPNWLAAQFYQHKSFSAVARNNGLGEADVPRMNKFATNVLGWDLAGGYILQRWEFLQAYFVDHNPENRPSIKEISNEIGASYTTCLHWRLAAEEKGEFLPHKIDAERWKEIINKPKELLFPASSQPNEA